MTKEAHFTISLKSFQPNIFLHTIMESPIHASRNILTMFASVS